MNKEIYTTKINGNNVSLTEDSLTVGDVTISHYHEEDCCEKVYADMDVLTSQIEDIQKLEPETLTIKGVEDMGFLLVFTSGVKIPLKVFVPCYNLQNGYYSDELLLIIEKEGSEKQIINITKYVKDDIHD